MHDLLPIAERIAACLKANKQTIVVAESSAGGLISAALLAVPGASAYFLGGGVVYTRPARSLLMDIADRDMKGLRSSSEPYARLLARSMRARFDASWALAETGAAGPTGNRYGDAAGHTCMAVAGVGMAEGAEVAATLETASADRTANMRAFAAAALALLEKQLAG